MIRSAPALLLALAAGLQPALAADISTSVRQYTVRGATMAEIERDFARKGPKVDSMGGSRHPGATRMEFSTNVDYRHEGGTCRVTGVRVALKITITVPHWPGHRKATPGLEAAWPVLEGDILRHERDHARIAATHARLLERRIAATGPARDCDSAQGAVKAVTERVMADHDRAQAAFDLREGRSFESRMRALLARAGAG